MSDRMCPHCEKLVGPKHFYRSGKTRCNNRRTWTKGRVWKLMTMIEAGMTDDDIGKKLNTTGIAVNLYRKRHGIPSRTETIPCSREVARQLGIGCAKSVVRWIERGLLRGRRGQLRGGGRQWYVQPDDLVGFLENPDHWHRWDPNRIVEPGLREFALELRGSVRFLTLSQVAEIHCVEPKTVYQWIRKGWLPAVRNGNHLVREDIAIAFRRPGIVRQQFVRDAIRELKRRGYNQAEIATLYGRGDSGNIGEWERCKREPLQHVVDRFAEVLERTADRTIEEQLAA